MNLFVRHPFVDVGEVSFYSSQFLFVVAFIYVCMDIADSPCCSYAGILTSQ